MTNDEIKPKRIRMYRGGGAARIAAEFAARHAANIPPKVKVKRSRNKVYRTFAPTNPNLQQARILTAAQINSVLDARKLVSRDAQKLTGVSHTEFSRIRNAQLQRFTLDRLITLLGRLDADVEVSVSFRLREREETGVSDDVIGESEAPVTG